MKKVICIILAIVFVITFCGCGREKGEDFTKSGRLVIVSGNTPDAPYNETIVVDKNTGVLYFMVYAFNHCGITPLLDSDGKPLLWEGE